MTDVSFLIPARSEMFLQKTIEDILSHIELDSEVIAICDGDWPLPPVDDHPRVTLIYHKESIGQRGGTNEAARLAQGKYVCKIDAHCSIDQGFDRKLVEAAEVLGPKVTQIPAMYNLHAFDWQCNACKHRSYQGPTPTTCENCKASSGFLRVMVWEPRRNKRTEYWRFDHEMHFQYWGDYKRREESKGDIVDVMTSIGACFFMARDRYFELGGLDEKHGTWGQYGVEIACKSWLSGGRHVVNKNTWYGHMFRTQGGDFGFPYPLSGGQVDKARQYSRNLWMQNTWPQQVHPLSWLIEKFAPIPAWHEPTGAKQLAAVKEAGERFSQRDRVGRLGTSVAPTEDVVPARSPAGSKGMVYYSDCRGDARILSAVRTRLQKISWDRGMPIVSVTLDPIDFGKNRVLPLERGYLTMFRQILEGLRTIDTEFVFFVEHDVLYAPEHFDFTPPRLDTVYYNQNVWKVSAEDGRALHYLCNQTSGICASRELLLEHYRKRVERVEQEGFNRRMGFEPGTRKIRHGGIDDIRHDVWMSTVPNIDIRHGVNLTQTRWKKEEFRNQKYTAGWTEAESVPGWGHVTGRFDEFLQEHA